MATYHGRNVVRKTLLEYAGDVAQVARVKPYRLQEGLRISCSPWTLRRAADWSSPCCRGAEWTLARRGTTAGRWPGARLSETVTPPTMSR